MHQCSDSHHLKLALPQGWSTYLLSQITWTKNITGRSQKIIDFSWNCTFTFRKKIMRDNYEEQKSPLLAYCQNICLLWSIALIHCCILTWVTKVLTLDVLTLLVPHRPLFGPAFATFCNSITRQPNELENCSNP